MNQILLIEDDASLASGLKKYLESEGLAVTHAMNLAEAKAVGTAFDLILLDWMLPDGQGIDFLAKLRKENQTLPVIFLTAKADLIDKVLGLESGANDYLVKPFEQRELLARIRVHLRKNLNVQDRIELGPLKIHLNNREVSFCDNKIETTKKEFDLLAMLAANPNKVFSREELLNKVWGFENFPTTRTVDTHVLQLRQKTHDDLIETVRGIGYRLRTDKEFT